MKTRHFFGKFAFMIAILLVLAACSNNGNSASNTSEGSGAQKLDWPTKNIELIVPFTAGGVSDILARSFAEAAKGIIDQPITIKNVGGGSGTVGNYELVKAKPDGYTWLWAATGHISSALHITPAQYKKDDFTIVNKVGDMVVTVVVSKDSPFRTLQDLIRYAKEHPGEVTVGNPGEGTVVAMLATMLEDSAGIKLQHVPFQGSGTLLPAVLGKHVMAGFMNVPEIRGQVEAGDLRALAVLSENRIDLLPNVPTSDEQGVKGVTGGAGHFIIIPNKVPDDLVQRIDELTKAVYESDKFKQLMEKAGYQLGYKTGADAKAEVDEWYVTTGEIYKKLGQIK